MHCLVEGCEHNPMWLVHIRRDGFRRDPYSEYCICDVHRELLQSSTPRLSDIPISGGGVLQPKDKIVPVNSNIDPGHWEPA